MEKVFDIKDTTICKGIAIVLMIFHHVVGKYYNSFDLSWYYTHGSGAVTSYLILFISTAGKVCVSLFTILAGYGMYKKHMSLSKINENYSRWKFVISRIMKFYSIYIPIWICFFAIRCINDWSTINDLVYFYNQNGNTMITIRNIIIDLLGFFGLFNTPSINYTWYVTVILILYILFPAMRYLTEKLKWLFVFMCMVPWVYLTIQGGVKEDVWYCYLAEFAIGILFATTGILDKLKTNINITNKIYSMLFLLIAWALRIVFGLVADIVFAISIIVFETQWLSNTGVISKILFILGINSANMWLTQTFVIQSIGARTNNIALQLALTFIITLVFSVGIEAIKRIVKKAVEKVRIT